MKCLPGGEISVCEIEHFGHPLAIAFTLSALFYYVELRKVANARTTEILANHRTALSNNRQGLSNIITGRPDASLSQIIMTIRKNMGQKRRYPPYNIEKTGENTYRLTMAVAGFSADEVDVTAYDDWLLVTGKAKTEDENGRFLHRGIAPRAFEQWFSFADHFKVVSASLVNGMLHIYLVHVPDKAKPLKIALLLIMVLWLWYLLFSISRIRISVHINAWMSTIVSLGALIYAGYYYPGELDCVVMTIILFLSFFSVAWNIWIYFGYIPAIDRAIRYSDKQIHALLSVIPTR
jgi:molecular chaperone IbpA